MGCVMKTYTIVAGVNGAGKSSLIGVLRKEITSLGEIVESIEMIDDCLEKEICFTQETTLSGHRILATIKKAIEKGYYIRLYYVGLNTVEESLVRIENRVKKGGHNIPDTDVKRRFNKRFEDLVAVLQYCDEATFYDNENGFVAVAEYKNGEILQIGSSRPNWLEELMEYMS